MIRRWAIVATLVGVAGCDETPTLHPPDAAVAVDASAVDAAIDTDAAAPLLLSQVGLYADIEARVLVPEAIEFRPAFELWSDGADKVRWIVLPPGTTIDSSDMDHWRFPVGTRLFKQFSVGGVAIETRLIERISETETFLGAFVWQADGNDAVFEPEGEINAGGTDHDVPRQVACAGCHDGEPGMVLGFAAVQLSDPGLPIDLAAVSPWLSDPPPPGESYPVPGTAAERAALGTLHANCGHCHHPGGPAYTDVDLELRIGIAERVAADTRAVATTVGAALTRWQVPGYSQRIVPGDPSASGVVARMSSRVGLDAMPPLATERADDLGVAAVADWIDGLPASD